MISMILAGLLIDVLVIARSGEFHLAELLSQRSHWYELFFHIGDTLVIAGLIGLVLELTEFARYFEERLSKVIGEDQFLSLFSPDKLESISRAALRTSLGKTITNPASQWEDFFGVVLHEIPTLFTQCYRENYSEVIHMKLEQAAATNGKSQQVSQMHTLYEYTVVSPWKDKEAMYVIRSRVTLGKIPGLEDLGEYYSARLWIDGKEITLGDQITRSSDARDVHVALEYPVTFQGTVHVKFELKEKELTRGFSGFLSLNMSYLTHNVNLAFSCEHPLQLDATLYGLATKEVRPNITSNMAVFAFPGWMLPGDGCFIDWVRDA
jgi:hypothetical protein